MTVILARLDRGRAAERVEHRAGANEFQQDHMDDGERENTIGRGAKQFVECLVTGSRKNASRSRGPRIRSAGLAQSAAEAWQVAGEPWQE